MFYGGVNLGTTTVGYAYDLGIQKLKLIMMALMKFLCLSSLKKIINLKPHGKIEIVFILVLLLKINL